MDSPVIQRPNTGRLRDGKFVRIECTVHKISDKGSCMWMSGSKQRIERRQAEELKDKIGDGFVQIDGDVRRNHARTLLFRQVRGGDNTLRQPSKHQ